MSAIDILARPGGFTFNNIDPLQRVLLITDGTLTEILEATLLERIGLIKVAQQVIYATASHVHLEPDPGEVVMERRILLRGAESGKNYVYAESFIAVDRLGPSFREELVNSNTPLGRLWREYKLETFKELLDVRCRPANDLSEYFDSARTSQLLVRTYRVFSRGRPVMVITEYFPTSYYLPAESIGKISLQESVFGG
jgi:chorismate-pyruvate lyase